MGKTKDLGHLAHIVSYDASNNITLPANLTVNGTITGYATTASLSSYATQSYVTTQISNLVASAPATLDTLNELATALGNDPNFATTIATSIGTKVPSTRTITINGTAYDLSADRSWNITSMIYPAAGIPLSTGTAWGTSITNNSANWNTAYGWGNHATAGYLTGITSTQVTTALGFTPVTNARTITINGTAFDLSANRSWTITATETDTLATVTSRGASTSTAVVFSGNMSAWNATTPGLGVGSIQIGAANGTANAGGAITFAARDGGGGSNAQAGIYILSDGAYGTRMYFATTDAYVTGSKTAMSISETGVVNITRGALQQGGNQVLHAGNYSSYALPISGGTVTGVANFGPDSGNDNGIGIRYGTSGYGRVRFYNDGTNHSTIHSFGNSWAGGASVGMINIDGNSGMSVGAWNNADMTVSKNGGTSVRSLTASGDVRGNDVYTTGGWFRNHTNTNGIYWSTTGWHIYPENANDIWVRSGNSTEATIHFMKGGTGSGNYIHNASDNAIGFLSTGRSWILRVDNGGGTTVYGGLTVNSSIRVNANTNLYLDYNYGCSIVGVYSSYRYQGVFSMGDSWKLAIDGTSPGNLYGLAWSHPNAGGQAGYLSTHGLLVMENGTTNTALANGIWTRGDVTAYSDARVKDNVEVIENAIDKINSIRGVTFTRNDREDKTKRFAGVIAQEVLAVMPEVVSESAEGTYSVAYGNMAGLFIEGFKEHDKIIKAQSEEIKQLKEIINGLAK